MPPRLSPLTSSPASCHPVCIRRWLVCGANGDLNVPPVFNTPALESNLPKNRHNLIKVYPGLSHLFQHNPSGNLTQSFSIEETIAPEVLNDISNWILSVTKR